MKTLLLSLCCVISITTFAQIPEDVIRFSYFTQNGTARSLGSGAVMGSLGGDLTAVFVNPAGLGFYKTNEAVISGGFIFQKNKGTYRTDDFSNSNHFMNFGPSGFVAAVPDLQKQNNSRAFALAFTQKASFNRVLNYNGLNNYSSFSEQFAEEFTGLNKKGYSIDDVLNVNSVAPYTAATSLYTYLIDTVRVNGNLIIKAAPEYLLDAGQALRQQMSRTTKGGLYELAFSYAGNIENKFLYGGTLGIPIVSYENNTSFSERDTSANTTNHFSSFTYNDNYTTKGAGINLKAGVIYRPKEYIRLGFALHSPDFMQLTDRRRSTLTTALENPVNTFNVTSDMFTNNQRGQSKYIQSSAWRALLSASYVFREITDVTKQRGFISADVEYVNHNGSKFSSNNEEPTEDEKIYYRSLNNVIKDIYKGAVNIKVGGELKFNTIMVRGGFGYYGSPYKDAPVKSNQMTISGGLGYRNKGFFADLAYVYAKEKGSDIPYRLSSSKSTYASVNDQRGNITVSVGVKF